MKNKLNSPDDEKTRYSKAWFFAENGTATRINLPNVQKVLQLILDRPEDGVKMEQYVLGHGEVVEKIVDRKCTSTCCIAGWGHVQWKIDQGERFYLTSSMSHESSSITRRYFNLTELEANALFFAAWSKKVPAHILDADHHTFYTTVGRWGSFAKLVTKAEVVAELQYILETGQVLPGPEGVEFEEVA